MTDRLAEIAARVEAATPGPWELIRVAGSTIVTTVAIHELGQRSMGVPEKKPDAELIAHAREDIPYLLGEVERLRDLLIEAGVTDA